MIHSSIQLKAKIRNMSGGNSYCENSGYVGKVDWQDVVESVNTLARMLEIA